MATDYNTAMAAGGQARRAGRHAEAKPHFEAAIAAAKPGSADLALSNYFLGLSEQDLSADERALQPLSAARALFEAQPDTWSAAVTGAALGLSLLRLRRYSDSANALERASAAMKGQPRADTALPAVTHNLAIAYTRGGEPARGLDTARAAVSLRERIDGPHHPLTIETQLIQAYAQIEVGDLDGAGELIRKCAKIVLAGPGEAHAFFADALLTEGWRVARLGDGGAAEALARRALYILDRIGTNEAAQAQRKYDAAALGSLWRTAPAASSVSDTALWHVSMQHTLRSYHAESLAFTPAPPRTLEWYFFVPASWPLSSALHAARLSFAGVNRFLNSREPADANFLDALSAEAKPAADAELQPEKLIALFRDRVWEPSIAFSLVKGDLSLPLEPQAFARALAAYGAPDAVIAPFGLDAAEIARARSDRHAVLAEVLMF